MAWTATVYGQPPSVNHIYTRVRGHWDRMAKVPRVATYQAGVVPVIRTAKPSGWRPEGQIRITYDFFLVRDADCDNMLKILNDAISVALDINDRMFLPCVRSKSIDKKNPRVEVEFGESQ